jgi:hypothetical protein
MTTNAPRAVIAWTLLVDGGPAESRAWIGGDELVVSAIDTRVAVGVAIDAMGLGGA